MRDATTARITKASRMFDLPDIGGWTDDNFTAHVESIKQQALAKVDKLSEVVLDATTAKVEESLAKLAGEHVKHIEGRVKKLASHAKKVLLKQQERAEGVEKDYVELSASMRGVSKNRKAWLEKLEGAVGPT